MAGGLRMTGKGGVIDKTRMVDDIYKSCCCIARVLYINTVLSSGMASAMQGQVTD